MSRLRGSMSRLWVRLAPVATQALLLTGCAYDGDNVCGEGQTYDEDLLRCLCSSGYGYTIDGCVKCGKHEIGGSNGCACEEGYVRSGTDAKCEEAPAADPPAESPDSSVASACTSNDECSGGAACDPDTSMCVAPPEGFGKACTSDDDCAGTQAEHCDTFSTQTCQQKNCSFEPDNCFVGYECCDLSAFGVADPLCVPEGYCL